MKKKTLLVIAPSYRPALGGVESHLLAVNKLLVKDYRVNVLVRYDTKIPRHQLLDGVSVTRLPKNVRPWSLVPWMLLHLFLFLNVDIVHSHDIYPHLIHRILRSKRWVHTFHGYEGYPVPEAAITGRRIIRKEVPYCFAVGSFIEKWYGTKCDAIIYGGIGSDIEVKKATNLKWDFAYIGRLEEDTGFVEYLKAMELLSENYNCIVVGGGTKLAWAESYIKEHKLNIELVGMKDSVDQYIIGSKVIFSSGYLGILEAAVLKKPVVAYWGTPIKRDYLNCHPIAKEIYITGYYKDIAKQAQVAHRLDRNKIAAAYEWARLQTWKAVADKYKLAYEGGQKS